MTPERKGELRKLCEAATPGPWRSEIDGFGAKAVIGPRMVFIDDGTGLRKYPCYADNVFIAASRTALPELLADLDAAQARAEALAGQVGEMRGKLEARQESYLRRVRTLGGDHATGIAAERAGTLQMVADDLGEILAQPPSALEAKVAAALALAEAYCIDDDGDSLRKAGDAYRAARNGGENG